MVASFCFWEHAWGVGEGNGARIIFTAREANMVRRHSHFSGFVTKTQCNSVGSHETKFLNFPQVFHF